MATYSADLLMSYLAQGESGVHGFANWGDAFNSNLAFLEDAVTDKSDIAVTTADVTLTDAQQRSLYLNLSGLLTGNRSIILKATQKGFWFVNNATTGAYTITVKPSAGTGVEVTQGSKAIIFSDGSSAVSINSATPGGLTSADIDADGTLAANSDAKIPSQKAVKTYADSLVASVNGRAGVVTGLAEASDVTTALAGKADASAVTTALSGKADAATTYTKTEVDTRIAGVDFVATGSIANGAFVALRSDGTVEAVTGTETLAATGADNTSITASNQIIVISAAYNATSGKFALLYYNATTTDTMYCVIGSVSGTTITFGTPATVASGTSFFSAGSVVWNAAGDKVIVAYNGASNYPYIIVGSVSGATITFGTAVVCGAFSSAGGQWYLFHDDTHGSRVLLMTVGKLVAATYSGTTVTMGTQVAFAPTGTSGIFSFYDAPNTRFICATTSASTTYVITATVSGTTLTVGTEVNSSTSDQLRGCVMEPSTGKLLATYPGGGNVAKARVITFSGTVPTINTAVDIAAIGGRVADMRLIYDTTNAKVAVFFQPLPINTITTYSVICAVGTISGTTVSFSEPTVVRSNGIPQFVSYGTYAFFRSDTGEIVFVYQSDLDFNRYHVLVGKIVGGVFVEQSDTLLKSTVPRGNSYNNDKGFIILNGGSLIDFGNWNTSLTTLVSFAFTLPTESTNADDWIGSSQATVTTGQSVSVGIRPRLVSGQTGLTAGTTYYLKGDGTLTTTDNGRRAGKAISATAMLLEAL